VIGAQDRGPGLRDAPERLARLVPVAQLIGHGAKIVGDLQHQRIGVAQTPLAGRVRLLEHPARGGRLVPLLVHPGELVRRDQDVRVVLAQPRTPNVHRVLEQLGGPGKIARAGHGLGPLPEGKERRRL
jgi:hypothetical protein